MVRAAVCGSDLHGYRHPRASRPPSTIIPGHEPVGVIAALGPGVLGLHEGQRVLIYHRGGCGACPQCLHGEPNICDGKQRERLDGSDADYMLFWADRMFPLADDVSWDTAVVISCQAGTAYAPLRRLRASGRDVIVVSGLGPVGLCAVALGQAMGATIIGIDPMKERRALGLQFGASHAIDPSAGDPTAQVLEFAPGGADGVVETSGNPGAQAKTVEFLRVQGTVAMVGLGHQVPSITPATMFRRQLSMYTSNLYPQWMLPEIVDFVQRRQVPLDQIITDRFAIDDASAAFKLADSATTGKVVFSWD
jgi:threonine dehydrogenase-like Zn-dependent dehydrogenase